MSTVDIPINAAKKVALDYGYDQVIIIGRKVGVGGREHCTTYGVNKEHCAVAGDVGLILQESEPFQKMRPCFLGSEYRVEIDLNLCKGGKTTGIVITKR